MRTPSPIVAAPRSPATEPAGYLCERSSDAAPTISAQAGYTVVCGLLLLAALAPMAAYAAALLPRLAAR